MGIHLYKYDGGIEYILKSECRNISIENISKVNEVYKQMMILFIEYNDTFDISYLDIDNFILACRNSMNMELKKSLYQNILSYISVELHRYEVNQIIDEIC